MFCGKCGNKIKEGNLFCTGCGEKADESVNNVAEPCNEVMVLLEDIFDGMDEDMRDGIYPGGAKFMIAVFSDLAPVVFSGKQFDQLELDQIQFLSFFHVDVLSRRIMTRLATGWSIDEANASIIKKYSQIPQDTVQRAIDISMTYLNKQFPRVKKQDEDYDKRISMANNIISLVSRPETNTSLEFLYINDPEYGLVSDKPVFISGFGELYKYLDRLAFPDGSKAQAERLGSTNNASLSTPIDIYKVIYPDGSEKSVYISLYGSTTSEAAPAGFILV